MDHIDKDVQTEHNVFRIIEEENKMLHYIRNNNIDVETLRHFIHKSHIKHSSEPYAFALEDITDTEDDDDDIEVGENISNKNQSRASVDRNRSVSDYIKTALIRTFLKTSDINFANEKNAAQQRNNVNDRPTVFRNVLNNKNVITTKKGTSERTCRKNQSRRKRRHKIQVMQCQPLTTTQPLLFNPYLPFLINEDLSSYNLTSNTTLESDNIQRNSSVGSFAPDVSFTNDQSQISDNDILFGRQFYTLIDSERIAHNDETNPPHYANNIMSSLQQIDIPAPNDQNMLPLFNDKYWPTMPQPQSTLVINKKHQSSSSSSFHQMQQQFGTLADPIDYVMSQQTVKIQHIPQTNKIKQVSEPLSGIPHQTHYPILNNLSQSSIFHNQQAQDKYTDRASMHICSELPHSVYKLSDISLNQQNETRPAYLPPRPIHKRKLNSTIVSNPVNQIKILNVTQLIPPNDQHQEIPLQQTQPVKQPLSFIGPQDKLSSYQVLPIQLERNPSLSIDPLQPTLNQYSSSNKEIWSKQTQINNNLSQLMWRTNAPVLETHNFIPSCRGRQKPNASIISNAQTGIGKRKYNRRKRGSSTGSGRNILQPDLLEVPSPEYASALACNVPSNNLQNTVPSEMLHNSNYNNPLPFGTCSVTNYDIPTQEVQLLSTSQFTEMIQPTDTRALPASELPTNNRYLPYSERLTRQTMPHFSNTLRSTLDDMRCVQVARPNMLVSQPWVNAARNNVQYTGESVYTNRFYNNRQWNSHTTMPHPHAWQPRRFDF